MVRVTGCSFDAAVIDVQKDRGQVETTGDECNLQDWSKRFS
jgi:hypothetical protein